jgi:hypothetical protein
MSIQGRYFRPRDTGLKGTGYDSKLEQRLHEGPLSQAEHHNGKLPYTWEHTYEPDFVVHHGGSTILVECKGYFMDREDATKYLWVRKSLPEGTKLIFCFENPHKGIHFQSKRQNGSRMTHAEWAEKNGFEWYDESTIGTILHD